VWLLSESCGNNINQYHLYKNMQTNCFAGSNKARPRNFGIKNKNKPTQTNNLLKVGLSKSVTLS
jgi:hypothetical protein